MIDTHVHLLDPARFPYPETSSGYVPSAGETGTLDDLLALLDENGIEQAVLVAASVYGPDNASILDALARYPARFRGIIGIDPQQPALLDTFAEHEGVAGIRLNLTNDLRTAMAPACKEIIRRAASNEFVVCIQAGPAATLAMLEDCGDCKIVLDHMGRPDLDGGLDALRVLGQRTDTWLKLSGGFRIASDAWPDPTPQIEEAVAVFSPSKLIWGSDWPFINLPSPVQPEYASCLEWARKLTDADLSKNAGQLFWRQS